MYYIIDNQCFPCFSYIKNLAKYSVVLLEGCETYQKNSFRNRYVISGSNGPIQLTIPIRGGRNQKALIQDVEIDTSENWQMKHWRSLVSSYNNSPYFDHYENAVKRLLFSEEKYLFKFNMDVLNWIILALKLDCEFYITNTYKKIYENDCDYRNQFSPKKSGLIVENDITKYSQVFEERHGFIGNLSILDLLFNTGPDAIHYLK